MLFGELFRVLVKSQRLVELRAATKVPTQHPMNRSAHPRSSKRITACSPVQGPRSGSLLWEKERKLEHPPEAEGQRFKQHRRARWPPRFSRGESASRQAPRRVRPEGPPGRSNGLTTLLLLDKPKRNMHTSLPQTKTFASNDAATTSLLAVVLPTAETTADALLPGPATLRPDLDPTHGTAPSCLP